MIIHAKHFIIIITFLLLMGNASASTAIATITNWQELTNGLSAKGWSSHPKLLYIKFNEEKEQFQENCDGCLFEFTWQNTDIFKEFQIRIKDTKLQSINSLRHNTLTLVFKPDFMYGFLENREVIFQIESECDKIKQIISTEIMNSKPNIMAKQTTEELDLNKLFARLKDNELKRWMANLDDVPPSKALCQETYKLLKYINDGDEHGFDKNKITLSPILTNYLDRASDSVRSHLLNYSDGKIQLNIKVIGYTDIDPFKRTIDYNATLKEPVYYDESSCRENTADKNSLTFVNFNTGAPSPALTNVPDRIKNNCQLSAVRAFNSLKYLKSKFPNTKIQFSYSAGGQGVGSTLALQRKINIKISLDAGKERK